MRKTVEAARIPALDGLRGAAVLAMSVYHLCWDLTYFGLTDFDLFANPGWLAFRTAILSAFLFIMGVALPLAAPAPWRRKLRRIGVIVLAAASVTGATLIVLPEDYVFFGVLHFIALAHLAGWLTMWWPVWLLLGLAGAACAAQWVTLAPFDAPGLIWLGLGTYAPHSIDFVPMAPWLAPVLVGVAAGRWVAPRRDRLAGLWRPTHWDRAITWTGRHSLPIYLIHQPVILGVLALSVPVPIPAPAPAHTCEAFCHSQGGSVSACVAYCACLRDFERDLNYPSLPRTRDESLIPTPPSDAGSLDRACRAPF